MTKTCILTDSTVQFPIPAFTGRKLVSVIPLKIDQHSEDPSSTSNLRAHDLPTSAPPEFDLQVYAPSVADFEDHLNQLSQHYSGIVVIVHTDSLSPTYQNARTAAKNIRGKVEIEVIDSRSIATGLGLVVLAASAAAQEDRSVTEIVDIIRSMLPRLYTIFCIPGLSYLYHSGYLGQAQSIVGEALNMLPLYALELGQLVPTQKARNNRHLVDLLHEFISEFETLDHIGFIQGVPPFENETRTLRERLAPDFADTPISEHTISSELAILLGPKTLGLFVLQSKGI